jgi:hypothetical protein
MGFLFESVVVYLMVWLEQIKFKTDEEVIFKKEKY